MPPAAAPRSASGFFTTGGNISLYSRFVSIKWADGRRNELRKSFKKNVLFLREGIIRRDLIPKRFDQLFKGG